MLYRRLAYLLSADYPKEDILNELDYRAGIALKTDITQDGIIDRNDVAAWQPRSNRTALRHDFGVYQHLQALVHAGAPLGVDSLYPTDREVGALDLSDAVISADAFGNGVAALVTPTASSTYKLQIIDLADSTHPRLAGSLETEFSGGTIAVQNNYFYVTNGTSLFIIDAANKDAPVQVANLPLPAPQDFQWISVSGNFAYLTTSSASCALIVVDISQPAAPAVRGTTTCAGSLGQSYYSSGRVYAPLGIDIQIFDVSQPDSPVTAGSIALTSGYPIYATATTAYILDTSSRLDIVDVTDSNKPSIITSRDASSFSPIGMDENLLFVESGTNLRIYDISVPADPKLLSDTPISSASPLHYSDGFAYQYDADQFMVLDLRDIRAAPIYKHAHLDTAEAMDISLDHDRAYLAGLTQGISVVDISDPDAPRQTDTMEAPGIVFKTVVTGGMLYTNGLFEVTQADIGSPSDAPTGNAGEPFGAPLAVGGDTLYSMAPDGLRVFDITQPDTLPLAKARYFPLNTYVDLSLNDAKTVACAAGFDKTLLFIDTATLVAVKTLNLASTPQSCRFYGNYAFVTTEDDIQVIDASTPDAASVVTQIPLKTASPFLFNGDVAYVAGDGTGLTHIYDVSDPAYPVLIKSVSNFLFRNAVLRNASIYGGNQIWDVSNPINPSLMGSVPLGEGEIVYLIGASDTSGYVITQNSTTGANSLYIIDVTDPTAPTVRSKTELPLYPSILPSFLDSSPTSMAVKDDTVYISGFRIGLLGIDVHDSLNPRLIASSFSPLFDIADIAAKDNYVYVADYVYGFHVLDFTDPANPTYHDISGASENTTALAIQGNLLYAVTDDGLQIIDISDPTHAIVIGSINLNFTLGTPKLAVAGSYAYVVGEQALRVVDVSDPVHPDLAGPAVHLAYHQSINSRSITIKGSKLYVGRGTAGVEVIDIADPIRPYTDTVIPVPALATAIQGDYLYLAGENGLDVVRPMDRPLP